MFELSKYKPRNMWTPFSNIEGVRSEINRLFDDLFAPVSSERHAGDYWYPAVDIHEDKDKYVLKVEIGGMKQ